MKTTTQIYHELTDFKGETVEQCVEDFRNLEKQEQDKICTRLIDNFNRIDDFANVRLFVNARCDHLEIKGIPL